VHDVFGVDISAAMIDLARRRVPGGTFRVGSLLDVEIPPCVAVAAVGEVVNYLFDPSHSDPAVKGLFRRVAAALAPGGVFLLDVAGPGRYPSGRQRIWNAGDDWVVVVAAEERGRRLTRAITTFRRVGELYRRDDEEHRQRLYPPAEVAKMLRAAGLRVRRLAAYGSLRFGPGHAGFLARNASAKRR
jgi:SAM-dependent methyltransferase